MAARWADDVMMDGYPKWFPGMAQVDDDGFIVERGHPQEGCLLEYCEGYEQDRARHIERFRSRRARTDADYADFSRITGEVGEVGDEFLSLARAFETVGNARVGDQLTRLQRRLRAAVEEILYCARVVNQARLKEARQASANVLSAALADARLAETAPTVQPTDKGE